jgi:hypothetical protein
MNREKLSVAKWHELARARYGDDPTFWRFKCPACGHTQTLNDFLLLGMDVKQAQKYLGFSCIGRWRATLDNENVVEFGEMDLGSGCEYSGGSAWNISPWDIEGRFMFGWDPNPCETCYDDGVVCEECGRRNVDCACPGESLIDCPDCRR